MKVLIHHTGPGTRPAGVWWLPKHRSRPQSFYLRREAYTDGARALLGDDYTGAAFTQANWENRVERLTESANPITTWTVEETDGDPKDLVIQRR